MKAAPLTLEPLTLRPVDAIKLLGAGLYEDARAAGWLKECARREGATRDCVRYATADVRAVEHRVLAGEYPPPKAVSRRGKQL